MAPPAETESAGNPASPASAEGRDGPASAPSADQLAVFRAACEQHLEFVWRFAAYCGVPKAVIEPLVHKVFGVIHGRLISLEHAEDLRISVAGITRNAVRSYLRQLGDHSPLEAAPPELGARPIHFGALPPRERPTACEQCDLILARMTETEREVFILCEIEGFSLSETAEALHIGESTLRSRLEDARKLFNVGAGELRAHQFWRTRQGEPDE